MHLGVALGVFLAVLLAAGSGTGGGALYVPLLVLLTGDPHAAVPLSKVTVLGLSVSAFVVNLNKKHPASTRPLINYDLACILEPITLVGACFGVVLNIVLSSNTILVLLIVVLGVTATKTFQTALKQWKDQPPSEGSREILMSQELESSLLVEDASETGDKPISLTRRFSSGFVALASFTEHYVEKYQTTLEPHVDVRVPILSLVTSSTLHLIFLFVSKGPAALVCGSILQIALMLCACVVQLLCGLLYAAYLIHYRKTHPSDDEDVNLGGYGWVNTSSIAKYMGLSFIAGLAAGGLGIGGGLIKGPLMMHIGLNPLSAVSTSTYMILFTSASNTISFILTGRLALESSLILFSIGLVASLIGVWSLNALLRATGKVSILTFILGGTIVISMVCLMIPPFLHQYAISMTVHDACKYINSQDPKY